MSGNVWFTGLGAPCALRCATPAGSARFEVAVDDWRGAPPARDQLLFVADDATDAAQWLGFVASTATKQDAEGAFYEIVTSRAAHNECAPDVVSLRAPALSLFMPLHRALPIRVTFDSGRVAQRTAGGTLYATKTREAQTVEEFRYEGLSRVSYDQVVAWFLEFGGEPFYWIDEQGRAARAQILDSTLERKDGHGLRDRTDLALRLALLDVEPALAS